MNNPSVQSQVIAAVVALLAAAGPVPAFRTRITPIAAAELPVYNVLPGEFEDEYTSTDGTDENFRFLVRCTAQAVDQVDTAVDALRVAAAKAILADPTLGGLVRWTRERGGKWEFESGEYDTVALALTYECEFTTSRSDPSVKLP